MTYKTLSKRFGNKAVDLEFGWMDAAVWSFDKSIRGIEQDHAGFTFSAQLGRLYLELSWYDIRHADKRGHP